MNQYKCVDCETIYVSEVCACKLQCPKCGSKRHKLIKILTKVFKF